MASTFPEPYIASIRIHPIKSLDPVAVESAVIGLAGGLVHDRE